MGGAPRCVWMTAGVVSFRLCPRDFACESCALDTVLSGREPARAAGRGLPASAAGDRLVELPRRIRALFPVPPRHRADRHYHTSHVWGQALTPGRVRFGLDDLANRLVGADAVWRLPSPGTTLATGDPLARAELDDLSIVLRAPLPGRVEARNEALADHPALVVWAPYDAGWLVELAPDQAPSPATGFLSDSATVGCWFEASVGRLAARCGRLAASGDAARLGPTLPDGGVPITSLRAALGPGRFEEALQELLSATVERPAPR